MPASFDNKKNLFFLQLFGWLVQAHRTHSSVLDASLAFPKEHQVFGPLKEDILKLTSID